METNKRLERVRKASYRLLSLLSGDERNVLVWAEVAHEAAHMAEHFQALDALLSAKGELPDDWFGAMGSWPSRDDHQQAEETTPAE
jgi:hypothetical protein